MAHQLFHLPKATAISDNLTLVAGARVRFFLTTTVTPTPVYQDAGLTTPHTQPVEADAAGRLPPVYLDPSILYRVTFTDSADVEIYPAVDPVNDQVLSQAIIGAFLYPRNGTEIGIGIAAADIGDYSKPPGYVTRYTNGVPNFNPATGVGTDNRLAIQKAFDYACATQGACWFEPGRYYTGPNAHAHHGTTNPGTAQLMLGTGGTQSSAKNVSVIGNGAEIYQGAAGKCWCVYEADNVRITGLKFFGYTGGTLGAARENDTPLALANRSYNVRIDNCYFTNSLGDCITIYGDLANNAEDRHCRNITISHCVLKERYGNGTQSVSGGTRSRLALAVIDCVALDVHDNIIYGEIDLEPNFNYEHMMDVDIHNNHFRSGHVTAQSSIGSAYWHDEPINYDANSTIEESIVLNSVATPIVSNVCVRDNNFDYGKITWPGGASLSFSRIEGNEFEVGWILGATFTTSARVKILNNTAKTVYSPNAIFIELTNGVTLFEVAGNAVKGSGWSSAVGFSGSGADSGANIWGPNFAESGVATNLTPHATSLVSGIPLIGTWTPVLTFVTPGDLVVAYTTQVGSSIRKGRECTITCDIVTSTFTHTTASGALRVTGLPLTAATLAGASWQAVCRYSGITKANYTQVSAYVNSAGTLIEFEASGSAQAAAALSVGDLPTGGTVRLIFTLTYLTA